LSGASWLGTSTCATWCATRRPDTRPCLARGPTGSAQAEEEGFVDLRPVGRQGQCPAKVLVENPLLDLGILVVGKVEIDVGVAAVGPGINMDGIVALLLVLDKDGQVGYREVALLLVKLARDGAQVDDSCSRPTSLNFVNEQLVAKRVLPNSTVRSATCGW
jgi:hypothetical protein